MEEEDRYVYSSNHFKLRNLFSLQLSLQPIKAKCNTNSAFTIKEGFFWVKAQLSYVVIFI